MCWSGDFKIREACVGKYLTGLHVVNKKLLVLTSHKAFINKMAIFISKMAAWIYSHSILKQRGKECYCALITVKINGPVL